MIDLSKVVYKKNDTGFILKIENKSLRTPLGRDVIAPNEELAMAIVEQLREQLSLGKAERTAIKGRLGGLHLFNFLCAIIDRGDKDLNKWIDELVEFASTDLLCYFATFPKELIFRQQEKWGSLVEKINSYMGVDFKITCGVNHINQPIDTLKTVREHISKLSVYEVFCLRSLIGIYSSFILSYAVLNGLIDYEEAYNLSILDELWQEEQWGEDAQAIKRRTQIKEELALTSTFLKHCR